MLILSVKTSDDELYDPISFVKTKRIEEGNSIAHVVLYLVNDTGGPNYIAHPSSGSSVNFELTKPITYKIFYFDDKDALEENMETCMSGLESTFKDIDEDDPSINKEKLAAEMFSVMFNCMSKYADKIVSKELDEKLFEESKVFSAKPSSASAFESLKPGDKIVKLNLSFKIELGDSTEEIKTSVCVLRNGDKIIKMVDAKDVSSYCEAAINKKLVDILITALNGSYLLMILLICGGVLLVLIIVVVVIMRRKKKKNTGQVKGR